MKLQEYFAERRTYTVEPLLTDTSLNITDSSQGSDDTKIHTIFASIIRTLGSVPLVFRIKDCITLPGVTITTCNNNYSVHVR